MKEKFENETEDYYDDYDDISENNFQNDNDNYITELKLNFKSILLKVCNNKQNSEESELEG